MSKICTSNHYFWIITVLVPLLFSCNKEDSKPEVSSKQKALVEINKFCSSLTPNHFAGIVLGKEKCLNDGINNYQSYSGTYDERIVMGMDTYPLTEADEAIFVLSPVVELSNFEQINQVFIIGKKEFTTPTSFQESGFQIYYQVLNKIKTNSENEFTFYFTRYGEQENSTIEVVDKYDLPWSGEPDPRKMRISLLINCKLYDESGQYKGEIKNGLLTNDVYVWPK